MDPITQGALGAIAAQTAASPSTVRRAAFAGLVGGMAPDLDVLIQSSSDPLLALQFHRHFTHSLAFIPVGGASVGVLLWWLLKWRGRDPGPLWQWILFATLGWATHGILDACTSYGTQLFWPFNDWRIAWNNVGIIDPIPTLAWLLGAIIAYRARKIRWAYIGLALGILYLLFGVVQRERAEDAIRALAHERGHHVQRLVVLPTVLNLFLWRTIYEHESVYQVDAVFLHLFAKPTIYSGESITAFNESLAPQDSVLAEDLARFRWFSDGWMARHPNDPMILGDVRYALLPNEVQPLWGIRLDPSQPDRHVKYEVFRTVDSEKWRRFRAMLLGQSLPSP